jgi:hypothetical protein
MNKYRVFRFDRDHYCVQIGEGRGRWRTLEEHCHPKLARQACDALIKREIEHINETMTVTHSGSTAA